MQASYTYLDAPAVAANKTVQCGAVWMVGLCTGVRATPLVYVATAHAVS